MKVKSVKRTAIAVRCSIVFAIFVAAFAVTDAIAQAPQPQFVPQAEDPENFPDGPGREETFYTCGACHAFKLVASQGFSRDRWIETIDLMTERHGMQKLDGNDREVILDYLAKAFPPRAPQNRGFQNPFLKQ